ncbi:MAG: antitoxin [Candidatus Schekmanbacteria bacterium]|nr:antitoxin [Candidatus Schekmanbacteria bacterium]
MPKLNPKLDQEEKELVESLEKGEWKSIAKLETEARRYQNYAKATFNTDEQINILISQKDAEAIQKKALEEGVPYQTLIASILHKYISGRLVEKKA